MKIRIERDALADAVAWTSRALSARGVGVGVGIGIETGKDSVIFTAFDRETSAQAEFDAVVEAAGQVLVPGRLLSDISKTLPAAPVVLELTSGHIELTCGRSSFTLPLIDSEFPAMMEMPTPIGHLGGNEFAAAVGQVASSASTNDLRVHLTGVLMEFNNDTITLAATDSFRLAVRETPWTPMVSEANGSVLVTAGRLSDISKGLADCEDVTIYAATTGGASVVGFSGKSKSGATRSIATSLVNAVFPPGFRGVAPANTPITAIVNTAELAAAVKRVRLVLDSSAQVLKAFINLKLADGEIVISASTQTSEAHEAIACEHEGEIERMRFSPGNFLDGLTAMNTPYVHIAFAEIAKPALFTGMSDEKTKSETDFRYLLMPMLAAD